VHEWLKQAILLYFRLKGMETTYAGPLEFHDKIPTKRGLAERGVRVVPPAVARYGSYLEPGVIMMPSYVNIGAWVGAGSMVDTWATVGSCAQIGRDVHLAGGVGIGGVLEPPSARPVIIEDGAFLASRCVVTEGVRVRRGAVLASNVHLNSSIHIVDVRGSEPVTHFGDVPERAVVVPGTRPREFPAGTFEVACALIIGERKGSTDTKTSLNDALREHGISA
jgi:2,3,4,5-tetrahydropyridine-2-carboxylate N-succinyltransferase